MEQHDCVLFLMQEYVQEHLDHIHSEKFTQEMIEHVSDLLCIQFECDISVFSNSLLIAYAMLQGRTASYSPVQGNVNEKLSIT